MPSIIFTHELPNGFSVWAAHDATEYRVDWNGRATFNLFVRHDGTSDWLNVDCFTSYAPNEVPVEFKANEAFMVANEIINDSVKGFNQC